MTLTGKDFGSKIMLPWTFYGFDDCTYRGYSKHLHHKSPLYSIKGNVTRYYMGEDQEPPSGIVEI